MNTAFKLTDSQDAPEPSLVLLFEQQHNIKMPSQLLEFWISYGNGGSPTQNFYYKVPTLETDCDLVAIYGLGHSDKYYNLDSRWDLNREYLPKEMLPFGRDSFGSLLCLSLSSMLDTTVYYWDWCSIADRHKATSCHWAANSLDDFVASLRIAEDS